MNRGSSALSVCVALIGAASFVVLLSQNVCAAELSRRWQGLYSYPDASNRAPVAFELNVTSVRGDSFNGRTTEPATFGDQPCSHLYANVSGQVTGDKIEFTKTYDGTCGQSHSVFYRGTLSGGFRRMEGTWSISNNWGGRFTAEAK